jgi:hypothetical protein
LPDRGVVGELRRNLLDDDGLPPLLLARQQHLPATPTAEGLADRVTGQGGADAPLIAHRPNPSESRSSARNYIFCCRQYNGVCANTLPSATSQPQDIPQRFPIGHIQTAACPVSANRPTGPIRLATLEIHQCTTHWETIFRPKSRQSNWFSRFST